MITIKIIEAEEAYNLRHEILRPHQSLEDCKYDTDNKDESFHIGAFIDDKLISIASFCMENHPDFSFENQYRLRAMATLQEYRLLGAGRLVVKYAEDIIKDKGFNFLWCNGRTSVKDYYLRLGFKIYGEEFDYPPIGNHVILYKELDII